MMRILLAQVPSPTEISKGVQDFGPLYLLVLACSGLLIALTYMFRTVRAKDELIAALHEKYGQQIAAMKDVHGEKIAALERSNGQKVETLLGAQLSTQNNTVNALDELKEIQLRMVLAMEKPTLRG